MSIILSKGKCRMEKVDVKYNYLFGGVIYTDIDSFMINGNSDFRKKKSKIINKEEIGTKIENKASKVHYDRKINYRAGNICAKCANLTRCPKMNLYSIKQLRRMPYIEAAVIVEMNNENTKKKYEDALNRYQEIMDDEDKELERKNLEEILEDSGSNIEAFYVYKCVNFLDDNVARIKRSKGY